MTVVWISREPACPSMQINRQPVIENDQLSLTVSSVLLAFSLPIVSALIYLNVPFPELAEMFPDEDIFPVAVIVPDAETVAADTVPVAVTSFVLTSPW